MIVLYAIANVGQDEVADRIRAAHLSASVWEGLGASSEFGVEQTTFVEFATTNVGLTDNFVKGLLESAGEVSAFRVINRSADASLLTRNGEVFKL